jgi:hypothetical protein
MPELTMSKRNGALVPRDQDDVRVYNNMIFKMQEGQPCTVTFSQKRSMAQHRTYWKMLAVALKHSEKLRAQWRTTKQLHATLKEEYCALHPDMYREVKMFDGSVRKTVFSESPRDMNQKDFNEFFIFVCEILEKLIGVDPLSLFMDVEK